MSEEIKKRIRQKWDDFNKKHVCSDICGRWGCGGPEFTQEELAVEFQGMNDILESMVITKEDREAFKNSNMGIAAEKFKKWQDSKPPVKVKMRRLSDL